MLPCQSLPEIFCWPWFSERHGYDFNGHLVRWPGGNVAIDPVEMRPELLDALAAEGVAQIVLTNRNHTRAAAALRARTGAQIAIHPADARFATETNKTSIDAALAVGQRVGPFEVLGMPGKSPGEIALSWTARRLLVVGDACVGKVPGALALLPDKVIDDGALLRQSLRQLADVDFDTLLLGDGTSILTGGREALRALVSTF